MKFQDFEVSHGLVQDLEKHGIVEPTKVQKQAIPIIFEDRDIIVQSETGSGKTIGFAIPTIEKIEPNGTVQALVITPTRELARQVGKEFKKFSENKGLRITLVYGGVSINPQIRKVKHSEIVVGTPGRLLDLLRRGELDLSNADYLIIDEADRLLDMGFIDDIDAIIRHMPEQRQSMMFSATINSRVFQMVNRYLKNPEKIMLENVIDKGVLKQYYYNVDENEKLSLLLHILEQEDHDLVLVFCNTKRSTRFVSGVLKRHGVSAECLNGDMSQHQREKTVKRFKSGQTKVLVATDVASRGLDIDNISHVVNYDLHDELETYTHRIGRTGRQGREGIAIILLSDRDYWKMDKVMAKYRDQIEKREPGEFKRIKLRRRKRRR